MMIQCHTRGAKRWSGRSSSASTKLEKIAAREEAKWQRRRPNAEIDHAASPPFITRAMFSESTKREDDVPSLTPRGPFALASPHRRLRSSPPPSDVADHPSPSLASADSPQNNAPSLTPRGPFALASPHRQLRSSPPPSDVADHPSHSLASADSPQPLRPSRCRLAPQFAPAEGHSRHRDMRSRR